ncbi:MAG: alpha/beta fold hydrolase [Caldilineaceae bacterium]|nr:alpha/beta fold hydrolase [Caldilineaceae bacterium]
MIDTFSPFQGEEHRSFHWEGGEAAAVLVHGFPGTPAEMRSVAKMLNEAGWTVHGLLLPGFGPEMPRIADYTPQDWINATAEKTRELRRTYRRVVLVGYSMGGAVSINAARLERPDQLVLISPFWRLGGSWQNRIWPVLRLIFRSFKPFRRADFSDPKVREGVYNFMPDIDLDDPAVQDELRRLSIPSALLDGLHAVGRMAYQNAAELTVPGIVVQGNNDLVVGLNNTRLLVQRLGDTFQYHEVDADHLIIDGDSAGFSLLQRHLLNYLSLAPAVTTSSRNGARPHKDA